MERAGKKATIKIQKRILERIEKDLKQEINFEELADRYDSYEYQSWTAELGDGKEVDVKLCCGNLKDIESNPLWTEAVLYDHGCEVSCSDVEKELSGEWILESDGVQYIVEVIPDEEIEEKLVVAENEDGTIADLIKVKNYDAAFQSVFSGYVGKWLDTQDEFNSYMKKKLTDYGYEIEYLDYEVVATYD